MASGARIHGLAGQNLETDLYADQRPQAKRKSKPHGTDTSCIRGQIGRLGVVPRRWANTGSRFTDGVWRVDEGLGRYRRSLPRPLGGHSNSNHLIGYNTVCISTAT